VIENPLKTPPRLFDPVALSDLPMMLMSPDPVVMSAVPVGPQGLIPVAD
jgi:hypothetical protein